MSPAARYPDDLLLNAWTGAGGAKGTRVEDPGAAAGKRPRSGLMLVAKQAPDLNDIEDARVGWGLVMADDPARSVADLASAKDAPDCIQELVKRRGGVVLRWSLANGAGRLRRCLPDGTHVPVALAGSQRGTQPGSLPFYLMIYANPKQVPWSVQYTLNLAGAVGRLDLEGAALDNYVGALLEGWSGARADVSRLVVWATEHGASDITAKMRQTIADPIFDALSQDPQVGAKAVRIPGAAATGAGLAAALAAQRPGLVVTTSHGNTDPGMATAALAATLGNFVDASQKLVGPQDLLSEGWEPDGAIWYAHACCSAGADSRTSFKDILQAYPGLSPAFLAAARVGASTAPLARALLGAKRPLRAFVGHIEPTFDWTLVDSTGQALTSGLREAFYDGLFQAKPHRLGYAMQAYFAQVGRLFGLWNTARSQMLDDPDAGPVALRFQLSALDRQSLVILGDPSVALPSLQAN